MISKLDQKRIHLLVIGVTLIVVGLILFSVMILFPRVIHAGESSLGGYRLKSIEERHEERSDYYEVKRKPHNRNVEVYNRRTGRRTEYKVKRPMVKSPIDELYEDFNRPLFED